MYKLYSKLEIQELVLETLERKINFSNKECFFLQNGMFITLNLPKFYDLNLWLFKPFQNIPLFQYKKDCGIESLELYIKCFNIIEKYYVVGEKTIVLLLEKDANKMILIHSSTIDMLLERSIFCNRPFIFEIESEI